MAFFYIIFRFVVGIGSFCTLLGTSLSATAYWVANTAHIGYSDGDSTTDLDNQLENSKMFKISSVSNNKTTSKWWKKIILDKYKPINTFNNAVIQSKKYNYTNDPSKYNPSFSPGYRNVGFLDYSNGNSLYKNTALYDVGYKTDNSANIQPTNSFSKQYYFGADASATTDFSWYSADPTIINDHQQPNLTPQLNSEYNGYFAGSRSFLYGLDFGLPSSLEYSMKTMSPTGANTSVADLSYQYNFSLANPFTNETTFTDSGSASGALPVNTHYDQIKDPAKKISDPNKNDFAFYQLWPSFTNHASNDKDQISKPWTIPMSDDKGSSGTLKPPKIGHYFDYDALPFNTNPNPKKVAFSYGAKTVNGNRDPKPDPNGFTPMHNPLYNPERLKGNFIGDSPASIAVNGRVLQFIQGNLLCYPFYVTDDANSLLYLIHCYIFYDQSTSSSRIITLYSQFKEHKNAADNKTKLSLEKRGMMNDLLFNDFKSASDKDIKNLNNGYKFCENMLPFFINFQSIQAQSDKTKSVIGKDKGGITPDLIHPHVNYEVPGFNAKWVKYLTTGAFSYPYDGQTKLLYAPDSATPKINTIITEYPKIREKLVVDAQNGSFTNHKKYHNVYINNDLLNYNQNIYKNNFAQAIQQNKVEYTKSICNRAINSYKYPPLEPIDWILYHFLLTNGSSEYFDANNKDRPSNLNAYNPYRYYTAIVGCHTDSTFSKPTKSNLYPNQFFSRFLLTSPTVGSSVGSASSNATTLSFSSQNLSEFSNSDKTIKGVDKLNHVYLGNGSEAVQSWIIVVSLIALGLIAAFFVYYFYRRKQIKIWREKKVMYQKIGPQTQRDIAVDDIIHLVNDVKLAAPTADKQSSDTEPEKTKPTLSLIGESNPQTKAEKQEVVKSSENDSEITTTNTSKITKSNN